MFKLVIFLLIALVIEAVGVNYLGKGLKQIGEPQNGSGREIGRLIGRAMTNRWILVGTALEAVFFLMLITLLKRHEVSLIWPLTSLGFVLTTFSATFINGEHVSQVRWSGVVLIVLGAALVGWSEVAKERKRELSFSNQSTIRMPLQ